MLALARTSLLRKFYTHCITVMRYVRYVDLDSPTLSHNAVRIQITDTKVRYVDLDLNRLLQLSISEPWG